VTHHPVPWSAAGDLLSSGPILRPTRSPVTRTALPLIQHCAFYFEARAACKAAAFSGLRFIRNKRARSTANHSVDGRHRAARYELRRALEMLDHPGGGTLAGSARQIGSIPVCVYLTSDN
jgi:hypothetical protein